MMTSNTVASDSLTVDLEYAAHTGLATRMGWSADRRHDLSSPLYAAQCGMFWVARRVEGILIDLA